MLLRILLAVTFCMSVLVPFDEVFAKDTFRLWPGVKVERKTKTTAVLRLRRPGASVGGTFDCSCWVDAGTCTLSISGSSMICSKASGDTCKGQCRLSTTIPSGVRGSLIRH
jgi:hypothetical protein